MPIYEYVCESCGHEFERLVFSHSPAPSCDRCQSDALKRVPSLFGFRSAAKSVAGGGSAGGCGSCHASTCTGCASGGRHGHPHG